jgi:hypothetical protein
MENQEDEEKSDDEQQDEGKSNFRVSTGIVSMYLTGRLLNAFVPYIGVALVIVALAWAIKLVMGTAEQ